MRALLVAALTAIGLSACGGSSSSSNTPTTSTVDDAAVESQLKQQLSTPTAQVTKVSCPSDVKATDGATFKCSVTWSNGATGKAQVTQVAPGKFTSKPVSGSVQVPGATVEKSIQADLAKQGAPNATVNCPDNIIVKVGTTVTCDVSSASGKANGQVTFTLSAEGTVDESSVQTS